jgi:chromosome segregation ATPase
MSAKKESIVIESGEAYRQLKRQFQDTVDEMKTLKEGKTVVETRLRSAESENDRQRYEIENSNRDKRALEGMIQSMQEESETLKNEKKTLETTLMNMQQTLQNLEYELSSSAEEIERLRSEKETVVSQSNEYYKSYQQLQLRYQDVLNDLEACTNDRASPQPRTEFDGVEQDFMSRINNRRQNQMRRNQIDEPGDSGWWN